MNKVFNDTIDETFKQQMREHRVEIRVKSVGNSVKYSSKVDAHKYKTLRHAHHLCDSIRDLKIDFRTPSASNIDFEHRNFVAVREIFHCARDKLISFWLSSGNDKIAAQIGLFDKIPPVIHRLMLTKYEGDFSKFITTFAHISRFKSYNNQFNLLPKFENLVEFTATILESDYIDANQQQSAASRLSADIKRYIENNPKLDEISLISIEQKIDSISAPTFVAQSVDLLKYKRVYLSYGLPGYTYIYFEKIASDDEETFTIKTTEIDPLIRYEFREISATFRSSNDLEVLAEHLASNADYRVRINLYVNSQLLFRESAAFATAVGSSRFTLTWDLEDNLKSTLVFQNGQLDIVLLKNDTNWNTSFDFRYWEFNLSAIYKFNITIKKFIKKDNKSLFEEGDVDEYARFKNGQLETNIEHFDSALVSALTGAKFIWRSKTIEHSLSQFIKNNSHTNLNEITIEFDEYLDSLRIDGWIIDGRGRVNNDFIIRLVKKRKTSSDDSRFP